MQKYKVGLNATGTAL